MMQLNPTKCNYMIFTRAQTDFATRLTVKNSTIDKLAVSKILGVWIDESLSWERNTKEICIKAYSRISMLSKLKYVGVSIEDLVDIYILFIRSTTEYCSVAFHSSLSVDQTTDLERIQKTCLKVILGESYVHYEAALEMTGLTKLYTRREKRVLETGGNLLINAVRNPL